MNTKQIIIPDDELLPWKEVKLEESVDLIKPKNQTMLGTPYYIEEPNQELYFDIKRYLGKITVVKIELTD